MFASGQPARESYLIRLLVLLYGWGDLDAARQFAATIPSKLLLEDVFIYHVATLWLQSGDYEKALETLDHLLEAEPDRGSLREQKATILALLGEREAAATEYALARELNGNPAAGSIGWALSFEYHQAAGDREGTIQRMDRLLQRDYGRWPAIYNFVRYDPRVQAMLERGARWLVGKRSAAVPDSSR